LPLEINHVTRIEKSSKFNIALVTILNVVHHLYCFFTHLHKIWYVD